MLGGNCSRKIVEWDFILFPIWVIAARVAELVLSRRFLIG
jgi:hypothetical protein